jgi:predicted MFS family arabinose efflux permease
LTTLLGIGFAVQAPASQAVIGEVVPRHEMTSALALAGVSFNISRIVGPALAGALIGLAGGMAVYAAVAVCSIASLTVLLRWRGLRRGSSLPPERLWSALRSGVRFVWHTPSCRVALRHTLVFMTCGSAAWALLPVLARDAYHLGAGGYGLLLGAFGIGGLAGVVVLPRLRRGRSPHGVVSLSALVFAGVTAVLACKAPLFVTLPALVVGGMAWMSGASLIYASVQVALPDWVRARGVSIYNLIYFLAMAGGAALWGAMAAAFGSQVALTLAALAMAAAAAYLRRTPLSIGAGRIVYPGEAGQGGAPTLDGALSPEEDPVLVQRIYRVRPDAVDAFLRAARGAGRSCRRNGASFWRIYRDLQTPGAYVERYMVDSWGELERHYERMTPEDRELRSRLDQHLVPGSEPVVHHYAVQSLPPEEDPTQFP